jgi:serine protease Do
MLTSPTAAACLVLAVASGLCSAATDQETIVLKDGHQVVGKVLAEKPTMLIVDLGFDVLKIPLDQVVQRRPADALPTAAPVPPGSEPPPPDGVYLVGLPRQIRPVRELVREYGEGVISIETPSSQGSGFVINGDGLVVTNNHVIEGETRISAIVYQNTSDGLARRRVEEVEIVALNPFVDLALLKLPTRQDLKLRPLVLGSLDDLRVGDGVFAVGNPLGLERSVSQGIVSTLNRNFQGLIYLQTDAAINPGNSGGPLFNLRGEVIGVTNMKASQGDNLGFAIPITYVKDFLRHRDAFAFDKDNPNTGYRYLDPPRRRRAEPAPSARLAGATETDGLKKPAH